MQNVIKLENKYPQTAWAQIKYDQKMSNLI